MKGQSDTLRYIKHEMSYKDYTHSLKYCYRCGSYKHKTSHKFFQFSSIKGQDAFIITSIALYNLFLMGEYFHLDPA